MAITMHDAVGEILALTAAYAEPRAHTGLAKAHAQRAYSAAKSRTKQVVDSIGSLAEMPHDERYRLGFLMLVVDALAAGKTPPDWVTPDDEDMFTSVRQELMRYVEAEKIAAFARDAGVAQTQVSRYARGERDLTGTTLAKVLVALGYELVRRAPRG